MALHHTRTGTLAFASCLVLAACDFTESPGRASDEAAREREVQSSANIGPTIAGSPSTRATIGTLYVFQPQAIDADGDTLTFSASGLPSWASINKQTGIVSGTPATTNTGTVSTIVLSVSDGASLASLPAFTVTVHSAADPALPPPPAGTNSPPVISGSPAPSVLATSHYSFIPAASDPDGNSLGFSISGKPAWATFSSATGALSGTPTASQAATYSGIVITVSDGIVSRSLPSFSITVTPPPSAGTATLSWSAPILNTNGSMLTNLAGYKVYHGTSAASLTDVRTVAATSSSYQFTGLASGTHYFAISAYNSAGAESTLSMVGSKSIQ